jgi:rubrerythrin
MSFIFKWKKQANWLRQQEQGELVDDQPRSEPETRGRAVFRCRVCGLEGEAGEYCPECLADTMEAVPR